MGTLAAAYRDLVDDIFHRGELRDLERYVHDDYTVVDAFVRERPPGPQGLRAFHGGTLADLRDVRYHIVDVVDAGDRLAAHFVVTATRAADGARVAVPGMSINHGEGGRLRRGWTVCDYRDLGRDDETTPDLEHVAAWAEGGRVEPGPLGRRYREIVDALYKHGGEGLHELVDPRYVAYDPFAQRGGGARGVREFHARFFATHRDLRYHVLDTFEAGDQVATRFIVRGVGPGGVPSCALGLSINQFDRERARRAAIYIRYGASLAAVRP